MKDLYLRRKVTSTRLVREWGVLQVFLSTPPPPPPPSQPAQTIIYGRSKLLSSETSSMANHRLCCLKGRTRQYATSSYSNSFKLWIYLPLLSVPEAGCVWKMPQEKICLFLFSCPTSFLLMYRDRKLASETPNFSFHSCLSVIQCQGGESFSIFGRRSY